ncbi:MAG: transcription termination factor Rho [Coriobacteriaceae bacterium]|jgi:transcription termination factor Rho|nr:transcription termination factor Rho [Coriobacteriaceae bacterium]
MAEETKQNNDAASDEAAEAPARRRVKRAPKEAEAEAPKAKAKAAKETAEEGEAPAKRARRTKKADDADASQASAEKKEAVAEKTADGASEGAGEGDSPKPRRRSRRTSVSVESGENAVESAGGKDRSSDDASSDEGKQPSRQQRNNQQRNNNQRNNQRHQRRQRNNREIEPSVTREELEALKVGELRERAAALEVDVTGMKKAELVDAVFDASVKAEGFLDVAGVLDILSDGYGFLRCSGYLPGEKDCYVGMSLIKRNGLRKGDYVEGTTRPARENEKFAAVQKISRVNGTPIEELSKRPRFSDLTPVYPEERLIMEHGHNTTTARVIDLVAPIGKGQRGLIVSPPKAGKTTILKDIAAAIHANNPEVHLMCLLVDERPEEVTDMQRSIHGEVISSTFDMPADNHIAVAEMVIERAKRLVENGEDVVILLDSITRLARAYNLAQPASGRVLSGGVDSTALYPPKRFLGAARNIENGGSLTILASALIETGSKMDEVIFEEFKGTGNMELRLDRSLADRRIFPAIDPVASGTRKEELLLDQQMSPIIWAVRRILANMNNTERAMDMLIKSIKQTDDNNEFLLRMARKAQHGKTESLEL